MIKHLEIDNMEVNNLHTKKDGPCHTLTTSKGVSSSKGCSTIIVNYEAALSKTESELI